MTPREIRNIRLENEYKEMLNIKNQGNMIDWAILGGTEPRVDKYKLTVNARSIIDSQPKYRDSHDIVIALPSNYPDTAPVTRMETSPYIFHPNWYSDGRYCHGRWEKSESLGHYVIRMVKTIFFDKEITNIDSPANEAANQWYIKNKTSSALPICPNSYPDPTKSKKFSLKSRDKNHHFKIQA